ncbi:Magnesium cobalt transport protein [Candidatus Cyrtobacter comes]|uniref:Magnesium cobalt transport protein n=1 Tax=Candidatus Cyrtobacter comes TaxID=675776 RepID=A0ABU5L923_9RICK|nr:magnesium transporter CorA family protein [Candidatus Cyrtobacter comes]MDZ5762354.1 Magnesium cobalt transport protein [Candidatus Cyrtobacter comes]
MITAYVYEGNVVKKFDISTSSAPPAGTTWIDVENPSLEEEQRLEKKLNINIPSRAEVNKIEVMSPFYKEEECHYMTITDLQNTAGDNFRGIAVTFILTNKFVITLRYTQTPTLAAFSSRVMRAPMICSSPEIAVIHMLDVIVNKTAETLETVGNELDRLLDSVFKKGSTGSTNVSSDYNAVIRKTGQTGNTISKNRESLMSINRMLLYFSQIETEIGHSKENKLRIRHITREVNSLNEYANFLSQRNSFLLDATLGMISVEQNMIIKIFTVASVVFMPPTLIASVYGMNFVNMPELHSVIGYPISISVMIISAVLPYAFFKKRKWI